MPQLCVRLAEPTKEHIMGAPGGARAYLERLVKADQAAHQTKDSAKEVERLQKQLKALEAKLASKEKLIEEAEELKLQAKRSRDAARYAREDLKEREAEVRRLKSLCYLAKSRSRYLTMALQRLASARNFDPDLPLVELVELNAKSALADAAGLDTDPPATAAEREMIGAGPM